MKTVEVLGQLRRVRKSGEGWVALCPSHDDSSHSLSIKEADDGKTLLKCFAGCDFKAIMESLGLTESDAFPDTRGEGIYTRGKSPEGGRWTRNNGKSDSERAQQPSSTSSSTFRQTGQSDPPPSLTLEELADAKGLPLDFLKGLGLSTITLQGKPAVKIPYFNKDGEEAATRFRLALIGGQRFRWKSGSHVMPYGLERLRGGAKGQDVLVVEGESDCWTCWHHGIPAVGIPGKSIWKTEWAAYFEGATVFVWQESGAEDFVERIGKDLPNAFVIVAPEGAKDLSEAHLKDEEVKALLEKLKASAVPVGRLLAERKSAAMQEAAQQAGDALTCPDVLKRLEDSARGMGYGGETKPLKQVYLGMTTRLLKLRKSQMPAHMLVKAQPSAGKSFVVDMTTFHLPEEAVHVIDAGSPRDLIYDDVDLSHKAVVFAEADNIPRGEDNPASSAIRHMLQDGYLHYDVVVRDEKTSEFATKHIRKPGPTVLITTSTRSLGQQLMTRLFTLEVSTETSQVRAALKAQAKADDAAKGPDPSLVALQRYLQLGAPWKVKVPYAEWLAENVTADDPRILRDFSRLISLVKSHALLHHRQRVADEQGRILAEVEDYETVFGLVRDSYEVSASEGANAAVRKVVNFVHLLRYEKGDEAVIRQADIVASGKDLSARKVSVSVNTALRQGWLVDRNNRHGRRTGPMDLVVGEALPSIHSLPQPSDLRTAFGSTLQSGRTSGRWTPTANYARDEGEEGPFDAHLPPFSDNLKEYIPSPSMESDEPPWLGDGLEREEDCP